MRVFALGLLAIAIVSGNEAKKICEPGVLSRKDCNECICSKDGTAEVCTLKSCDIQSSYDQRVRRDVTEENVQAVEASLQKKKICEPGVSSKVDCNNCICSKDGTFQACTMMRCLSHGLSDATVNQEIPENFGQTGKSSSESFEMVSDNPLLREKRQVSYNRPCEAGKRFKIYCNECTCGSDGFSVACTRMACPEGVYNEDGSLKNREQVSENPQLREKRQVSYNGPCEAGKRFKIYCNECTCGSDGFSVVCTRMACPDGVYNEDGSLKNPEEVTNTPVLRQKRQVHGDVHCEPGKSFKMYCNLCSCASNGRLAACTVKACPEGVYNFDGSLKNPEQVSNTPVLRQKRQISEDVHCQPGKSFKMYCNTCSCGSNGRVAACTYMYCPDGIYNFDGSLRNPEQVSNTPVLRQKRQNSEDVHCEPGKMFKMYCNTCSCGSDGRLAACTAMYCPEGVYNFDGSLKNPEQVSNTPVLRQKRQDIEDIHCEPGKMFKMYCNTCSCGSDGRMGACTLMACPEGVYNFDGSLKNPEQVSNTLVLRQKRQISEDVHCEPGKSFKVYCNTCSCRSDGRMGACTYKYCPEGMYNFDGSLKSATTTPTAQ